jgi:hypothetical protein
MLGNYLKILLHKFSHKNNKCSSSLSPKIRDYIENCGYPRNHTYYICKNNLLPEGKLASRAKKISSLYPEKLTSLLDLSSCKGFFVLAANCERKLGIDVNLQNIEVGKALKNYLNQKNTQFELLTLDKLSEKIHSYGSAYQTVLLINTYQYLFFGSELAPGFLSHEKIFSYLNQICSDRIIFNNRIELDRCQNKKQVKESGEIAKQYNQDSLITAAEKYFDVIPQGKIGREPLLVFKKKIT